LVVGNEFGCNAGSSTNLEIAPLSVTLQPGIYLSDDSGLMEQFDTNGVGSAFAFTPVYPSGLAFDAAGNLYVANWGDENSIRKIATNGVSSLVATNVNWPSGLAIGADGNIYAADWDRIEKITTNGMVSTYISGINGANGLAFDRAGNLYVSDDQNNTIKKYATDGTVTLFTTNGLDGPNGLAFDSAGNLYVANYNDATVWKYDPTGNGTLFANTNLSGPFTLAFDGVDNLYVLNVNNSTITRVAPDGGSTVWSSPDVTGGEYIAVWPLPAQLIPTNSFSAETIYGTTDSGSVEQFSLFGSESTFAGGTGSQQCAAFDSTGNLYVVDQANHLVKKYAPGGSGTVFTTNLDDPIGLAIDPMDNVFVADANGIEKFAPDGSGTNFWSGAGNLQGLAFDGTGNLYLADYDNNRVLEFDTNGVSSVFTTDVSQPVSLAFDGSGNLYVANYATNTIGKFSATGADLGIFAVVAGQPTGLAFDSMGNLYVATTDEIQKITPAAAVSLFAETFVNRLAIWPGLKAGQATTPTPEAAIFSSSTFTGGEFQFSVTGTIGANYVIEATTNLVPADWQPIATNTAPFVFTNTGLFSQRFFRVVTH
jgi:sugar lactone lactonase YvrE